MLVTQRLSNERSTWSSRRPGGARDEGIEALYRIGDCVAPRIIAEAIFDGHRLAREIDSENPAVRCRTSASGSCSGRPSSPRWLTGKCGAVGGVRDRTLRPRSFRVRTWKVRARNERGLRRCVTGVIRRCHGFRSISGQASRVALIKTDFPLRSARLRNLDRVADGAGSPPASGARGRRSGPGARAARVPPVSQERLDGRA